MSAAPWLLIEPPAKFSPDTGLCDRIMGRIAVTETGCWRWTSWIDKDGYGRLTVKDQRIKAHRASWEAFCGAIPAGRHIDHLCRNRSCVNPGHLEPVTKRENDRRGFGACAKNARKTHCLRGHELVGANVRRSLGARWCRKCDVIRQRAYLARRRDGAPS